MISFFSFGIEGQNHTLKAVVLGEGLKVLAAAELKSYQVFQSYQVEVQEVLVPVVVKDKKGNYVRGLKKEDFLLVSDDKTMEVSYLSTRVPSGLTWCRWLISVIPCGIKSMMFCWLPGILPSS